MPREQRAAKDRKELIRLPRALKEAALAPVRAKRAAVSTERPAAPYDFGAAAFLRIAGLRPELDRFHADHGGPDRVDDAIEAAVADRVARGAAFGLGMVDPHNGYFIGYDFGTSTTKVVLRHPYRRGSAFALDVPAALSSNELPHLWPTLVFYDRITGALRLCPTDGASALSGFKSALIEDRGHRMCGGSGATMTEAATGFLALHFAYVFGALAEREEAARLAGINVGVPVAAMAEAKACTAFERIVRAAILLVPQAATLTLDDVRVALSLDDQAPIPFMLHTELSGAIAGYCEQTRKFIGPHMIVDCGSATLDVASFHLGESGKIGIYAASVERLGADACAAYRRGGATVEECRQASRYQEYRVFRDTLDQRRADFTQTDGQLFPYQVVTIGGGMAGEVHAPFFEKMAPGFVRPFHRPGLGTDLQYDPDADPARLILADGFARDPIALRDVAMPRDRPPALPPTAPEPVTKDQV